jgi:hypothetical protein
MYVYVLTGDSSKFQILILTLFTKSEFLFAVSFKESGHQNVSFCLGLDRQFVYDLIVVKQKYVAVTLCLNSQQNSSSITNNKRNTIGEKSSQGSSKKM